MSDSFGHGVRISLNIRNDLELDELVGAAGNALSPMQKGIMALCVVWGAVGTALYFKRRGNG